MTPGQRDAFFAASGFHATTLNGWLRISCGLLITVVAVFIIVGLIKLLDDGIIHEKMRFILYLFSLSAVLMLFFTFVVA